MTEAGEKWLEDTIKKSGDNWDAEACIRAFCDAVRCEAATINRGYEAREDHLIAEAFRRTKSKLLGE